MQGSERDPEISASMAIVLVASRIGSAFERRVIDTEFSKELRRREGPGSNSRSGAMATNATVATIRMQLLQQEEPQRAECGTPNRREQGDYLREQVAACHTVFVANPYCTSCFIQRYNCSLQFLAAEAYKIMNQT